MDMEVEGVTVEVRIDHRAAVVRDKVEDSGRSRFYSCCAPLSESLGLLEPPVVTLSLDSTA